MAVPGYPGLWALGDCAAIPDERSGGSYPPTAQFALREAKVAAGNVLSVIKGRAPRPFSQRSLGVFVPLGKFSAAAQVFGLKVSGPLAWWLYRSYYLYQLPRLERKVKVLIDWNLALIFRRDIVQQGYLQKRRNVEGPLRGRPDHHSPGRARPEVLRHPHGTGKGGAS